MSGKNNDTSGLGEFISGAICVLIVMAFICSIIWGFTYAVIGDKEHRQTERAAKYGAIEIVSDITPPDKIGFSTKNGAALSKRTDIKVRVTSYDACTGEPSVRLFARYGESKQSVYLVRVIPPKPIPADVDYISGFQVSEQRNFTLAELRQYHDELVWDYSCSEVK